MCVAGGGGGMNHRGENENLGQPHLVGLDQTSWESDARWLIISTFKHNAIRKKCFQATIILTSVAQ